MFTKLFLKDAVERAISTFAQTVVAIVTVLAPLSGTDLLSFNWLPVLLVGVVAAFYSFLKSIVASKTGDTQSASFVVDSKEMK